MLQADALVVESEQEVFTAMIALKEGRGSFADALIAALGAKAGCSATATFDRRAPRLPASSCSRPNGAAPCRSATQKANFRSTSDPVVGGCILSHCEAPWCFSFWFSLGGTRFPVIPGQADLTGKKFPFTHHGNLPASD